MTAKITNRIEFPVGSTIWATVNLKSAGIWAEKAEDYGGLFTWDEARGLTSTYRSTAWFSGTLPGGSTTKEGGASTPTDRGTDGSICPWEWRLPTIYEFQTLVGAPGISLQDGKSGMSNYSSAGLTIANTSPTLIFPNTGLGGGAEIGSSGAYWTSTEQSASQAYRITITSFRCNGFLYYSGKSSTFSVRCVQDAPTE